MRREQFWDNSGGRDMSSSDASSIQPEKMAKLLSNKKDKGQTLYALCMLYYTLGMRGKAPARDQWGASTN